MAHFENAVRPFMSYDQLNNPRVIVVDMINGFVKEGALADRKIEEAVLPIASLLEQTQKPALFICDRHEAGCREFEQFPSHCLKGDPESEIVEELKGYADEVIEKNAISAFVTRDFQNWLEKLDPDCDIVVTGCCTDLCVLQLVLPLQSWLNENNRNANRIIVPVNCVETYHIEGVHDAGLWNQFALQNMEMNGVKVIEGFTQEGML